MAIAPLSDYFEQSLSLVIERLVSIIVIAIVYRLCLLSLSLSLVILSCHPLLSLCYAPDDSAENDLQVFRCAEAKQVPEKTKEA